MKVSYDHYKNDYIFVFDHFFLSNRFFYHSICNFSFISLTVVYFVGTNKRTGAVAVERMTKCRRRKAKVRSSTGRKRKEGSDEGVMASDFRV